MFFFLCISLLYGEEPYASKLKAAPDELIHMFERDEISSIDEKRTLSPRS